MKKRFIVALSSSTSERDEAFTGYIKAKNLGWWHWINNFWLLADSSGQLTAEKLRDDLDDLYPKVRKMIFELSSEGDTWAGFGPKTKDNNMFDWVDKYWQE